MSSTSEVPDLCPLCGQSNRCTLASSPVSTQPCWCFSETIDPARLQALPEALRDKTCLCPRCAGVLDASQNRDA